jgi:ABC-type multidrug transport system ATPase subunit
MLAVGTVDQILKSHLQGDDRNQLSESQIQIVATILSDMELAVAWLRNQNGLDDVQSNQRELRFVCSQGLEFQADLLARMVDQGIRVASFASKQTSLEEVFMKVTQGRVQ